MNEDNRKQKNATSKGGRGDIWMSEIIAWNKLHITLDKNFFKPNWIEMVC